MAMASPEDQYFIYENRLASFQGPHPVNKSRASTAGRAKSLRWPHKTLSPVDLARAGFFYEPFPGSPDNVVCYLCSKSLDGWEEDDDPLVEHIKHSPTCGWAIMTAIEADLGEYRQLHPLEPALIDARKATFGGRWPYESKKGFKCKTKQLAEAGWKYTPTLESDDMATCAYCQLALDGWEAGDKPIDEHQKRSPNCDFFTLIDQYPAPPKRGRGKASKASRLSIQSVATVATAVSDIASAGDITVDHEDSVMTVASGMAPAAKKTSRAKKAPAKGRKTKAKKDDPVEVLEDEPQEVEAPRPPKSTRGRKRASDAMEDSIVTNAEAPAPKKRATRVRGADAGDTSVMTVASQDIELADAMPSKSGGRKKATAKATRKVSQASLKAKASTASVRGNVPEEEEIDRQLQADLEHPLTDDDDLAADSDLERQRAPAPAKGRPKKATTRKASGQTRKEQSKAYAMLDPTPAEPDDEELEVELKAMEEEVQEPPAELEPLVVPKKGRKAGTRKASKQTKKPKEEIQQVDDVDQTMEDATSVPDSIQDPAPEPVQEPEPEPEPEVDAEPAIDPDASTGTVVNNSTRRSSTTKRGRGRPPKNSTSSQGVAEQQEDRRSSGLAAQTEEPLDPAPSRGSLTGGSKKIARKPVPSPVTAPAPEETHVSPRAQTPTREKSLPPLPPPSATPATPRVHTTPSAKQATISPSQSPQSSDAENHPPSSRQTSGANPKRVVLAPVASTPVRSSPSKRNVVAGLQSSTPWTAIDLDAVFSPGDSANKENGVDKLLRRGEELTSPEKRMTVEEWIYHNAGQAEQKLKHECEAMVASFEKEGTRALGVLEGLIVE